MTLMTERQRQDEKEASHALYKNPKYRHLGIRVSCPVDQNGSVKYYCGAQAVNLDVTTARPARRDG